MILCGASVQGEMIKINLAPFSLSIIAPLTQAGLNPARDFAPRMFAFLASWGRAALPDDNYGFLVVHILAPVAGGSTASLFFTRFLELLMVKKSCKCA